MKTKLLTLLTLVVFAPAVALAQPQICNSADHHSVPESGASILLLGAAITGLLIVVRRFRK